MIKTYFGPKISGLWKFSRRAAWNSPVELKAVLPEKHCLAGLKIDCETVSPSEVRSFIRRIVRLAGTGKAFTNENAFLQAVSAVFGVDESKDENRVQVVKDKIIPLLIRDPRLLSSVMELLPGYSAWTASGKQRLMPVAVAVINMLKGRDIFDPAAVEELQIAHPSFQYLTDTYPFYANPLGIMKRHLPPLPVLQLPQYRKSGTIRCLDVATAPKADGSPTLIMLKRAFSRCLVGYDFEFYGTDIAMPVFKLTKSGDIDYSDYIDPQTRKFLPETMIGGIKYLNAAEPKYNVLDDGFFAGQKFDLISVCMALHHLKIEGESNDPRPLSSREIINPAGERLNEKIKVFMAPSTQKVVDRMLDRLEIGGILFVNPFLPGPQIHQHSDMFFIIRRVDQKSFMLYDQFPIPFMPKDIKELASREIGFIEGKKEPHGFYIKLNEFCHPGIVSIYPNRSQEFYGAVQKILDRADLLAYRYLSWGKGVWESVIRTLQAIREQKALSEILEVYLANVPSHNPLKMELLEDARRTIRTF